MKRGPRAAWIAGEKFGHLTALAPIGKTQRCEAEWLCLCSCLNVTTVRISKLRFGAIRSCGCLIGSRPRHDELTAERLRNLLHYDPATGVFAWRVSDGHRRIVGAAAGGKNSEGYRKIRIDGRRYPAHRLAWLYEHGKWPDNQVDHRYGNRSDNCLANIRPANSSQNRQNAALSKNNMSGYKGVSFDARSRSRPWLARITHNGRTRHLGYHPTAEAAHAVYCSAAAGLFGEFANFGECRPTDAKKPT
jgi:hypothetical protein